MEHTINIDTVTHTAEALLIDLPTASWFIFHHKAIKCYQHSYYRYLTFTTNHTGDISMVVKMTDSLIHKATQGRPVRVLHDA